MARVRLKHPDWGDDLHSLAFTMRSLGGRFRLHGMLNAYWEFLKFELPSIDGEDQAWRRCIDTAREGPNDIFPWEVAPVLKQETYVLQPRSVVLLAQSLLGS